MKEMFLWVLNNSIPAFWLFLAILVVRFFLSQKSRRISCLLWGLLAIRLILPIGLESNMSVLPATEPIVQDTFTQTVQFPFEVNSAPEEDTSRDLTALQNLKLESKTGSERMDVVGILSVLWLAGSAGMILYAVVRSISMKRQLAASLALEANVYSCDYIDEPFVFGVFRPKIYLPSCLKPGELPYVLAHEQAHLKRKDNFWKPFGYILLSLYWFDPFVWIAYRLFCRDIEVACDESAIQNMGPSEKADYSRALLHFSGLKAKTVMPLAFGEKDVKHRITRILCYKKPAVWIGVVGIIAVIVMAVCFLTNPVNAASADPANVDTTNLLLIGKNATNEDRPNTFALLTLDPGKKSIKVTVIPSWTCLRFRVTDWKQVPHEGQGRLGDIYGLGRHMEITDGGIAPIIKEGLASNLGVEINGAVEIDEDVFSGIVDALGGIDLNLETDEWDQLCADGILPDRNADGTYHLDGNCVPSYQKLDIANDTLDRKIQRQSKVFKEILGKCQKLSKGQLSALLDVTLPLVATDMEDGQLQTAKTQLLDLFPSAKVELQICPNRESSEETQLDFGTIQHTVWVPDLEKCRELLGTNSLNQ